jgi:hypothetical protein
MNKNTDEVMTVLAPAQKRNVPFAMVSVEDLILPE